jgi:hypothetical protein
MAKNESVTGSTSQERRKDTMRNRRILISLIVIIVFALSAAPAVSRYVLIHESHDAEHHVASHDAVAPVDHDHLALHEMHDFVAQHFSHDAIVHDDTFGTATEWAHDWELRWVDYEVSGHLIRLYHVTNKQHPDQRYVSLHNAEHGHYAEWHSVH